MDPLDWSHGLWPPDPPVKEEAMKDRALFYVVRHGSTPLNGQNKFRGNINPPLDEHGRYDAFKIAGYLHGVPFSAIYHSDHKRAADTAKIIHAALDKSAPRVPTSALRSWNFGDFSGQTKTPELMKEFQHFIDNPDVPVPGGESLSAFRRRVGGKLSELARKAKSGPVLIVTSSSVIHEVSRRATGDEKRLRVGPAGVVRITKAGGQVLKRGAASGDGAHGS